VAWLDVNSLPLTYDDRRIIDDVRFRIVKKDGNEWNLQVRPVRRDDAGRYRCTVNTFPVRSKVVYLHVKGDYTTLELPVTLVGLNIIVIEDNISRRAPLAEGQ